MPPVPPHGSGAPETGRTQLVLIGSGIDAAALGEELDACRRDADAPPADEHGMWGVLRYVADGEEPPDSP